MNVRAGDHYFEIMVDHKNAFNQEQFETRYSEVLDKYPIIVGDIGYEQLRLKGFYEDKNKKADINRRFSSIQDYLLEYCNFGCAYFVLRRLTAHEVVRNEAEDVEVEVKETSVEELEMDAVKVEEPVEHTPAQETEDLSTGKTLKDFLK
ncbi:YutD family protein [Macrococcus brunensis]|uniref:YutD family protein n=1 Tax=Macrococcus brunensis TaxID=198483 RepID=UPI001EF09BE1|nr:YutD family protein [Macrococcus brunensis]ULG72590.1 YutD family protein [Macrococcus brunensis]ULG74844.1 YutD family protein [Macrococcus brunensis]